MSIGIHTSTVQLSSSWTIIDGEVFASRGPHVFARQTRAVPAKVARLTRDMDAAKAEIARRIRARGTMIRTRPDRKTQP